LVKELEAKEERPWSTYNKGKPITQNQVGRLLKDFSIYSRNIRRGNKILKGYYAHQFKDAFDRYIPSSPLFPESEPLRCYTASENNDLGQKTEPLQDGSVAVRENDLTMEKNMECSGVAVGNPETSDSQGFDWANGVQHGESVTDAWAKIKADHAARRIKGE
jgi:putative DNA primase/helicase